MACAPERTLHVSHDGESGGNQSATHLQPSRLEESVCGWKEPVAFWLWSRHAGKPDAGRLSGLARVETVEHETKDGRRLRGYRLGAASKAGTQVPPRGYLLIAQGNATLADQILPAFAAFAYDGLDVYAFDYRGYGRSQGKRRLMALVSDYAELIDHLDSLHTGARRFYGTSFGGILLLKALQGRARQARIVIDSTPSRLSPHGCPEAYDPVANLPADSTRILVVSGLRDRVVPPVDSQALREAVRQRGGKAILDPDFGHAFGGDSASAHARRMDVARAFLSDTQAP